MLSFSCATIFPDQKRQRWCQNFLCKVVHQSVYFQKLCASELVFKNVQSLLLGGLEAELVGLEHLSTLLCENTCSFSVVVAWRWQLAATRLAPGPDASWTVPQSKPQMQWPGHTHRKRSRKTKTPLKIYVRCTGMNAIQLDLSCFVTSSESSSWSTKSVTFPMRWSH